MELKNVFVIKCNKLEDWSLKKLALSDDDLSKLKDENLQENLKRNNIPDWTESNEKLKSSKKYKVYMKENTYHRSIFLHLKQNLKRKDIEGIGDISNIFYNKTPQYDTLVYLFEGKNKVKKYYIYKITRNLKLENQYLFMMELGHHHLGIRKKVGIDQLNSLHVIMGGLTLPIENCVGCFYEDNIQTYLEVYDASLFDDIFNTSETQEKYAHSAITNFNNKKWMIAESIQNPIKSEPGVTVKIPNNEEINQLIKKYHSVRKPLSNYTNNSKRIIKKINIKGPARLLYRQGQIRQQYHRRPGP